MVIRQVHSWSAMVCEKLYCGRAWCQNRLICGRVTILSKGLSHVPTPRCAACGRSTQCSNAGNLSSFTSISNPHPQRTGSWFPAVKTPMLELCEADRHSQAHQVRNAIVARLTQSTKRSKSLGLTRKVITQHPARFLQVPQKSYAHAQHLACKIG
jgi:hypothetical protein